MLLLLLLPILVSGYLVCYFNPKDYYKLHRYDGQLLYLKTATMGLACCVISVIVLYASIASCAAVADKVELLATTIRGLGAFAEPGHPLLVVLGVLLTIVMILSSIAWCLLGRLKLYAFSLLLSDDSNKQKSIAKIILMGSILNDSPIDKLFLLSYVKEEQLLITLSDRKVYIGVITDLGEPNEKNGPNQEVSITPILSGYRKKDSLEVIFTTFYPSVIEISKDQEVPPNLNLSVNDSINHHSSLSIVIKQDEIMSASLFDTKSYAQIVQRSKKLSES